MMAHINRYLAPLFTCLKKDFVLIYKYHYLMGGLNISLDAFSSLSNIYNKVDMRLCDQRYNSYCLITAKNKPALMILFCAM